MVVIENYKSMDPILQEINRNYIALPPADVTDNNQVINVILFTIIERLKKKDALFAELYQKPFYGGSYWDGTKNSKPDEYDVHVHCKLPAYSIIEQSNKPGWIHVKCPKKAVLRKLKRDGYLDTEKVMLWFHNILSTTLGGEKTANKRRTILVTSCGNFDLTFRRHGPAFTFYVRGSVNKNEINFHLDFVPCFVIPEDNYPEHGFAPNPTSRGETFIVAKPLKTEILENHQFRHINTRYWRLSFQNQERDLMKDKLHFKPTLRLLKKMRDRLRNDCIASYFIKNTMLLQLEKRKAEFWSQPLSTVFMEVFKDYKEAIQKKNIPCYWYSADNLIGHIRKKDLRKIGNELADIFNVMEKSPGDPAVAKYFLTHNEYSQYLRSRNQ